MYAKAYTTRTHISIGGVQDQNILIEQSTNYSNRTFTRNANYFCYGKSVSYISTYIDYYAFNEGH